MENFISIKGLSDQLGLSKSYIYKLSSGNILPKYCPSGKLIFFKKSEVEAWLESHRIASQAELESEIDLTNYRNGRRSL
ncbi:helix-turn-helix domain-containing protein [Pedobacter sp. N36a]|uniref:helix-turn-helix transcriptional regulator n=1 Tax=Pedobacter sp. N36a TaxID=2767996 RepID=UPI001656B5A8|nr:helix-turn-helix domain-containing protein [Pedobacter sp. N36a]